MLTENRTKLLIAIIGLIGILGGAFFANWDKVFPPSHPTYNGNNKSKPPEPPPKEPNDFAQRLEELYRGLENNEREMVKAQKEIERLRPFLETDRDAQQAIENQERWLDELGMSRNQVERKIKGLREQRQENHN